MGLTYMPEGEEASGDGSGASTEVEPTVDYSDKKIVVSELLCYINFYHNSSAPENIKRIILVFIY